MTRKEEGKLDEQERMPATGGEALDLSKPTKLRAVRRVEVRENGKLGELMNLADNLQSATGWTHKDHKAPKKEKSTKLAKRGEIMPGKRFI